jgi:hypothetical protein
MFKTCIIFDVKPKALKSMKTWTMQFVDWWVIYPDFCELWGQIKTDPTLADVPAEIWHHGGMASF